MRYFISFFIIFSFFFLGCTKDNLANHDILSDDDETFEEEWAVPKSQIIGSGYPFPVILNPTYTNIYNNDLLASDLVLLLKRDNQVYVYPHKHLYVESVNDNINNIPIAITYCPKTGSGIGINRIIQNDTLLITASGYLFKNNMMPMDVQSGRTWSQMSNKNLKGELDIHRNTFELVETKWENIPTKFPNAKVFVTVQDSLFGGLSTSDRNDEEPNAGSSSDQPILKPRLRYLGIINGRQSASIFSYSHFKEGWSISNIWAGSNILVIGNNDMHTIAAFKSHEVFEPIQNKFPIVMTDSSGSEWDIFGEAVSGSRKGEKLKQPFAYVAYGYAWPEFFSNIKLYD